MTLRQLLQAYMCNPSDIRSCIKSTQSFKKLLRSIDVPGFKSFFDLLELSLGERYPAPIELGNFLEMIGVNLDVDLNDFIGPFVGLDRIGFNFKEIDFRPDDLYEKFKASLKELPSHELRKFVREIDVISPRGVSRLHLSDSKYLVPVGRDNVDAIISYFHGDERKYIRERYDCDDYAKVFKGFLSRTGLGNLSAAYAAGEFIKSGNRIYHAAVLIVYYEGSKLNYIIYEPQRELWFYEPGENIDRIRLHFVFF